VLKVAFFSHMNVFPQGAYTFFRSLVLARPGRFYFQSRALMWGGEMPFASGKKRMLKMNRVLRKGLWVQIGLNRLRNRKLSTAIHITVNRSLQVCNCRDYCL
jgi:hypothetical protein